MDEQQVRLLVRQAIARHLAAPAPSLAATAPPMTSPSRSASSALPVESAPAQRSIVAHQFVIARPAGETDCLIEPSVTCNHCGYCLCYGH